MGVYRVTKKFPDTSAPIPPMAEVKSDPPQLGVVHHWQLYFRGRYVADTSVPEIAEEWKELAWRANRA